VTTLYIVRHGQAEGNLYRRIQGQFDGALTELGHKQAEALVPRFRDILLDGVYSSDLSRTILTAAPLCLSKGLPIHTDPRLREVDVGAWEDKTFGTVAWSDPECYRDFNENPLRWNLPGADNYDSLTSRTLSALEDICKAHPDGTVAVFCHGYLIRLLLIELFHGRAYWEQPQNGGEKEAEIGICGNTGVTRLTHDEGGYTLHEMYDVSHLSPELRKKGPAVKELRIAPMGREIDMYIKYRKDAWELIYGDLRGFNGSGFWMDAQNTMGPDPEAMVVAWDGTTPVGMLQLSPGRDAKKGVGYIPFIYLREEYRHMGLGIQLIGHAISFYRKRGRTKLQLSVAPTNENALKFYHKYGFQKVGKNKGMFGHLLLLEKDISLPTLPKELIVKKL